MTWRGGPAGRPRATQQSPAATAPFAQTPVDEAEEEAQLAAALAASLRVSGEVPPQAPQEDRADTAESAPEPTNAAPETSGAAPSTVPAAKSQPKRAATAGDDRFYTVTRAPAGAVCHLGIHRGSWAAVAAMLGLPDARLRGTGFHLRGFDREQPALDYWTSEGWEPPVPRHY